ncbi:glutathione S-transferase domain-containing protein [Capsaspora owczarzaki ATCC 30864]|uniref:Glutathione S-transferase domain-containing protein n=1 Tax=Capsaspora owczarzaki (strain ATCC 30864) TaxID=595528 RepID=A0A0D2UJE3_CAPO3|nr:glutathione S-transferase domain-containing protein [Capsaspora owczarzaki ATCC 30864]KJE95201.1 glutathione S-transferase domain-containing protein [Capsaspora owczarzaki ATCC 30864]|eukprot:XP_004346352.1 glutathione S-transferase domain-containing protein [Capsaspora owczarzaki ATCC 30864]
MSAGLSLYFDAMSQPSRAVLILLRANNLPFTPKIINVVKGDQYKPEFKKINPNKKIPVIDDNGFVLFESHAILRYLCNKYNLPDHWYPKDPQKRALVDQYLDWHHTYTRTAAHHFREKYMAPRFGIQIDEKSSAESFKTFQFALKQLDTNFLQSNRFIIGGDKPSIADISAVCELIQLQMVRFDFSPFANVDKWMKDVAASVPAFDEVHKIFYSVRDRELAGLSTAPKAKL